MEELKRCPFCGGEAEFEYTESYSSHRYYFVQCTECGCKSDDFEDDPGMKKAVAAWNNRKPVDDVLERIIERMEMCSINEPLTENGVKVGTVKVLPLSAAVQIMKEGLM